MKKAATVSTYIAAAPPAVRVMLRQLRKAVQDVAPAAEEKVSSGMPYYDYHGRLAYFAAFKHHVSFFVMGKMRTTFAHELKEYQKAKLRYSSRSALPYPSD